MKPRSFRELCDLLRDEAGGAAVEACTGAMETLLLTVEDVEFTLSHDARTDKGDLLVEVVFGRLPDGLAAQACEALMEINGLMRWARASTFCREPETRKIVLRYAYPLAGSVTDLYSSMCAIADVASGWRDHWFVARQGGSGLELLLSASSESAPL